MAVVPDLAADVEEGAAPLSVLFDASGSTSGGAITKYEFDWDGDDVYDLDNLADPTPAAHIYTEPGVYTAKVRVTSDEPDTQVATLEITVREPAEQALLDLGNLSIDISAETHSLLKITQKYIDKLDAILTKETT